MADPIPSTPLPPSNPTTQHDEISFPSYAIRQVEILDVGTGKPVRTHPFLLHAIQRDYPLLGRHSPNGLLQNVFGFSQLLEHVQLFRGQAMDYDPHTGRLLVFVKPRHFYFGSLGQSYSSRGKVALDYELGFRNILGLWEATRFKYEQRLRDGSTLQATLSLPYLVRPDRTLSLDLLRSRSFLCERLQAKEETLAVEVQQAISPERRDAVRVEVARKQLRGEPEDFPGEDYHGISGPQTIVSASLSSERSTNPRPWFFNTFSTQLKAEVSMAGGGVGGRGGAAPAAKFSWTTFLTVPLRRFFPKVDWMIDEYKYFKLELEAYQSASAHVALSAKGFSPFHRHYFARTRGFAGLASNYPFASGLGLGPGGFRAQLSWAAHLRLNLNHFPVFQGSPLKPFWHASLYTTNFNLLPAILADLSAGVGLGYSLGPSARLELLYNFGHWSAAAPHPHLTKPETFQLRLSMND